MAADPTERRDQSRSDEGGWAGIVVAIGAGVIGAVQIGKVPAVLPLIRADFGLDLAASAWILSCFNIIGIVLGAASGALTGGLGARRTASLGLWLLAAGSALGGVAPSFAALLACRILEGVGFTLLTTAAPTMINASAGPRRQKLAFGLWGSYMATGQTLMFLLAPLALPTIGWRGVWVLNGLLLASYAVGIFFAPGREDGQKSAAAGLRLRHLWRDTYEVGTSRGPLLLALTFSCYTLQYIGLLGFLPTLLLERNGFALETASLMTAPIGVVNVIGNLGGGYLLQRGARPWRLMLLSVCLMAGCGSAVYGLPLPVTISYGLCLIFSLVGGMLPAAVFSSVPLQSPSPGLVGATNGLVVQGSNLGQTIGPTLIGAIATMTGSWSWPGLVFLAAGLVGAVASCSLGRTRSV